MVQTFSPFWKEAPFARLLIPFIAGIILQDIFRFDILLLAVSTCTFVAGFLFIISVGIRQRYQFRYIAGVVICVLILLTGAILTYYQNAGNNSTAVNKIYHEGDILLISIEEPFQERNKSFKTITQVTGYIRGKKIYKASGKIVLYIFKDAITPSIDYGSQLLLFRKPERFRNSGNPGSMDYQRYAFLNGYSFRVFANKKDFLLLDQIGSADPFKKFLIESRKNICTILRQYIPDTQVYGLAEALLIGYKEDLDQDLVRAYSNTGVVHVIAISGLHLGLLYLILKILIHPLTVIRRTKWLKSAVIIILLWVFSLMTGGSASVLRSAVMFTAILAGESLSRKISIYNCLAASAFLLLCYKPHWLFDIGFQLSYSAVLSILLFMKPVYNITFIPNKILDYFWQLCSVTIAAQILTTPVSIYYFHQFPVYFLLANFIAVPLSGIILIAELMLCCLYLFPEIATPLGYIIYGLIDLMNRSIVEIDQLPFSTIKQIHCSFFQLVLIYASIISVTVFFHYRLRSGFHVCLISLLLITVITTLNRIEHHSQKIFVVYNIAGSHVSEVLWGRRSFTRARIQSANLEPGKNILNASHSFYKISERNKFPVYRDYIRLGESHILFADSNTEIKIGTAGKIHLLVVSDNNLNSREILDRYRPEMIIMDPTNSVYTTNAWKTACKKKGIQIHDVVNKGAFVMTAN